MGNVNMFQYYKKKMIFQRTAQFQNYFINLLLTCQIESSFFKISF